MPSHSAVKWKMKPRASGSRIFISVRSTSYRGTTVWHDAIHHRGAETPFVKLNLTRLRTLASSRSCHDFTRNRREFADSYHEFYSQLAILFHLKLVLRSASHCFVASVRGPLRYSPFAHTWRSLVDPAIFLLPSSTVRTCRLKCRRCAP